MDHVEQPAVAVGEEARYRDLKADLQALAADGLAYVSSEVELQKARGTFALGSVKSIALLGFAAVLLVFFALIALTVGLVIGLTPLIGPIGATLVVFAALAVLAVICALMAAGRWKRMIAALSNPKGT